MKLGKAPLLEGKTIIAGTETSSCLIVVDVGIDYTQYNPHYAERERHELVVVPRPKPPARETGRTYPKKVTRDLPYASHTSNFLSSIA